MLLILEEYFKDYPVKRKIVEGMYSRGISVNQGCLYLRDIEIPISEFAKALNVNRRTVYDTIKLIEGREEIRSVMSLIDSAPDICRIAPLMGDQVVTIRAKQGYFSKVLNGSMDTFRKYGCYMKELYGRNSYKDETIIRAIFHKSVPAKVFAELEKIDGVRQIIMSSPSDNPDYLLCEKCLVKICPSKLSSDLQQEEYI
ncbi:regulator [Oxyplasma meridianum]|uniref:Regulator n=1 Tax=Oxyplasma meridianum TaxID=3073602 RepID=A0AAX4NIW2_9ARCH